MAQDDLDRIPSIVPARDGAPESVGRKGGRASAGRRGGNGGSGGGARSGGNGGGRGVGPLAGLFIAASLLVAAAACAWAWQLQQQAESADARLSDYAERIGDLEARLADTDEGMTQSAAVQAAKIRELDSEVRKLWDNVWKRSKARLAKLESSSASQAKSLSGLESSLADVEQQLAAAAGDIASLKSVSGDLSRLMESARSNQAEVERVADALNSIELDLAKLSKRVQGNEEWVRSINAFRGQINASMTDLQNTVRALQSGP